MDTALPQKFPFILDRNLAKANNNHNMRILIFKKMKYVQQIHVKIIVLSQYSEVPMKIRLTYNIVVNQHCFLLFRHLKEDLAGELSQEQIDKMSDRELEYHYFRSTTSIS